MGPGIRKCVAVCCSALQCVVVCCSVVQRVAVCCSPQITGSFWLILLLEQEVQVIRSILQHVAVCCSALQCGVVC